MNGNEMVISYTGTNDLADVANWAIGIAAPMPQIFAAVDYYFACKAAHPEVTNISFTGHSLGGGLASLMAVYFNKAATVFDQAPFQVNAVSSSVTSDVVSYMIGKGYMDAAFDTYSTSPLIFANTREANVTHYYLEGEVLNAFRVSFNTLVGQEYVFSTGDTTASGGDLHSMALMTAIQASNTFREVVKNLPDLVSLLANSNLYAADPQSRDLDLLRQMLRHQFGIEDAITPDNMLERFATDMTKLAQPGGLTVKDGSGPYINAMNDVSKALTAFAMQMYYEDTANAKDATKQLFTAVTGGVQFDMADVSKKILTAFTQSHPVLLNDAKGYELYFKNYLHNGLVFTAEERNLIEPALSNMRDWYVQAGTSGMNVTDTHNRHAFMLGGSYDDLLTGGNKTDLLVGNAGADTLSGGDGDDILLGVTGNDTLKGENGNDWLNGGSGNDDLNGGAGDDILEGDANENQGGGNDTLDGGEGNDQLKGGLGNDTYNFSGSFGTDIATDSDGSGQLIINGQTLSTANFKLENIYKDDANGYTFTRLNEGSTIVITKESDPNRIIINDWSATHNLSLNLTGDTPTAPTATLSGDFKKKIDDHGTTDTNDDTYVITNGSYTADETAPDGEVDALDLINGTIAIAGVGGKDVIDGKGGDDYLNGKSGDDYIEGGNGSDYIQGGLGKDTLNGGAGDDFIYGASDEDIDMPTHVNFTKPVNDWTHPQATGLNWVAGYNDTDVYSNGTPISNTQPVPRNRLADDQGNSIDGGDGNDFIAAGTGTDYVHGGADKDFIYGMDKDDILFGDAGNDVVYGDGTNGDDSNSVVWSLPQQHGNDIVDGGDGDDILYGQGKDDIIFGGKDNDKIWGDDQNTALLDASHHGSDYIDGGEGNDQIVGGGKDDTLFGGAGDDNIWGDDAEENLAKEQHGHDVIYGSSGNDNLYGNAGNDYLDGGEGNDQLLGGDGNDTLIASSGNDVLAGGAGDDAYIINSKGIVHIVDTEGNNTMRFGAGITQDKIKLRLGSLMLDLGDGNQIHIENFNQGDVFNNNSISRFEFADGSSITSTELFARGFDLDGTNVADVIAGTNITDRMNGLAGDDTMAGFQGDDIINGGIGNDYIYGGDGIDTHR